MASTVSPAPQRPELSYVHVCRIPTTRSQASPIRGNQWDSVAEGAADGT